MPGRVSAVAHPVVSWPVCGVPAGVSAVSRPVSRIGVLASVPAWPSGSVSADVPAMAPLVSQLVFMSASPIVTVRVAVVKAGKSCLCVWVRA